MPDAYWLLDRGSNGDDIPIDEVIVTDGPPSAGRASSHTLACVFWEEGLYDYTALSEPAVTGHPDRHDAAHAYTEYAARAVTVETAYNGQPYFYEATDAPEIDVSTFFVAVRPPAARGIEDYYAVITGGGRASPSRPERLRLDLELTYLGEVADYNSRSDARDALEA